jgi:oligopeptide/dipeptide ABC transporter, ATP-binding protein, C-terminal domain
MTNDTISDGLTDADIKKEEIILSVQELSKSFPIKQNLFDEISRKPQKSVKAVDKVSFSIKNGETMGLVGESGCGKSTLSKTLIHLYKPDSGKIIFEGQDLSKLTGNELRNARRKMQMVFQDPYSSLNPRLNVHDMLKEALTVHKICPKNQMDDKIEELLEMVGMDISMGSRFPGEFSGGQRQRLGIARALAVNPDFLIADEPVSALDVSIQAQVINLLSEIQEKFHLTLLFISHDLRVVRHITHRVAVMYLGRIVEIGPTEELFSRPFHPYSEILVKAAPELDPRKRTDENIISGEPSSPIDLPKGCRFCTRCPFAAEKCSEKEPELTEMGENRMVACYFPQNLK